MKLYEPFKSKAKNKKYSVYIIKDDNIKLIHFGDTRYQHFFDKIGEYPELNHLDQDRRNRYLKRSMKIRNAKGELTAHDITSANYWSINFLW
jgi:cyclopropane fatty-acyl-phospholipid synthase-like methyltransferase